ncbi:MAG: TonB-dependent receptor [bacterium]|nr:TonB-dependent receptor [bacterium]
MRLKFTPILFILMLLITGELYALSVSGQVTGKNTGEPAPGVSVGIDELRAVTTTDAGGEFLINDIEPGHYHLRIAHPTAGEKVIPVRVKKDFSIKIELDTANTEGYKNYNTRPEERFGSHTLRSETLEEMPMKGGIDSLYMLQTLPGVATSFTLASVPLIRGENPAYTRYYIDDIPIDYPYHYLAGFAPIFSSINKENIESVEVMTGPSPLYYDDTLGSVINIKTKDVVEKGVHGKVLINPVLPFYPTIHATIAPIKDLSITFTGRRTILDWLVDASGVSVAGNEIYYQDHYFKAVYNLFSNHRFTVLSLSSHDKWNTNKLYVVNAENGYHTEALKWEFLVNKELYLKTILSSYTVEHTFQDPDSDTTPIDITYNPQQFRLYQELDALFGRYYFKGGYEFIIYNGEVKANTNLGVIYNDELMNQAGTTTEVTSDISGVSLSVFSEGGARFNPDWFLFPIWVNLGLKYKHYGPLNNNSVGYRFMGGVDITPKTTAYVGTGSTFAHADMYYYTGIVNPDYEDSRSYNTVLGVKSNFFRDIIGQVELYYIHYSTLLTKNGVLIHAGRLKTNSQINAYGTEESGNSFGAEFFLKGRYKFLYGWMSYSLSFARRSADSQNLDDYASDFGQTHVFKIAIAARLEKFTTSIVWHTYSSLPYTPISGATANGSEYDATYGEYNSERYSTHHRIDLKITKPLSGKNNKLYVEAQSFFGENKSYPLFDRTKEYGVNNPDPAVDFPPVYLLVGVELCF